MPGIQRAAPGPSFDGHVRAVAHFGDAVPLRLLSDDLRPVVVLVGSEAQATARTQARGVLRLCCPRLWLHTGHDLDGVTALRRAFRWECLVPIPIGSDDGAGTMWAKVSGGRRIRSKRWVARRRRVG